MGLLKKDRAQCRAFRTQLEDAASADPDAKELAELLAAAPVVLIEHAAGCGDCRAAAETLLTSRALLSEMPSLAEAGGPWCATRVMAAIAARRSEFARVPDTWTFLPKLAARLTWVSAIALLLASGWLYQKPAATPARHVATDITGEPFVSNAMPANNDEVLVSLSEKPR
ncbi:MAG: hypothetical protein ACRD51_13210 [Candidatus Acidiferrum sp.]